MSRISGQTPTGKRVTGSSGARVSEVLSGYSEGTYGSGEFSDWPPPAPIGGVVGQGRSSLVTGGRR